MNVFIIIIIMETNKKVLHIKLKKYTNHGLLYLVFVIFIITEIFDDFLDYTLKGPSMLHSILQIFLFAPFLSYYQLLF